ncbi:ABC transporter ATP-binding protein [Litoribacillus peritrichatus]|uniref:ABC transporter ATP-binding protein n=2 Tax=Litoribacillus peritrichatus TaxID=718191 RepID=A0ABP7MJ64_9GAMM
MLPGNRMHPDKPLTQRALAPEEHTLSQFDSVDVLSISNLHCKYGNTEVVKSASFSLHSGEIGCLLGPSGCGKTTILRTIAGFQEIDQGDIKVDGQIIASNNKLLPPEKRNVGMVFQDYALFPHLSVLENVMFGLKNKSVESEQRALDMLATVKLEALANRYPHELSGGQQQRIALARALAPKPKLILLDEPFSNLDTELRRTLSLEVRDILKEQNTSAILVTHDQEEAFTVADKIGIMMNGQIQQWGTPYDLYHEPLNRNIASFIGKGSFLPAQVETAHSVSCELGVATSAQPLLHPEGAVVDVLVRPEDIVSDKDSALVVKITEKHFWGASCYYGLELPSKQLISTVLSSHLNFEVGDHIGIRFDADHLVTFSR